MNKTIIIGRVNSLGALAINALTNQKEIIFDVKNNHFDKNGNMTVTFNTIVAFDKIAESVSKKLNLEDLCCIEGRIDNRLNQVIAEKVSLLSAK